MFAPLKVWGNPSAKAAYTIELFPIPGPESCPPSESVLVYAASFQEAFEIAKRQALALNLEPRRRSLN